jgi:hypothetical protein
MKSYPAIVLLIALHHNVFSQADTLKEIQRQFEILTEGIETIKVGLIDSEAEKHLEISEERYGYIFCLILGV